MHRARVQGADAALILRVDVRAALEQFSGSNAADVSDPRSHCGSARARRATAVSASARQRCRVHVGAALRQQFDDLLRACCRGPRKRELRRRVQRARAAVRRRHRLCAPGRAAVPRFPETRTRRDHQRGSAAGRRWSSGDPRLSSASTTASLRAVTAALSASRAARRLSAPDRAPSSSRRSTTARMTLPGRTHECGAPCAVDGIDRASRARAVFPPRRCRRLRPLDRSGRAARGAAVSTAASSASAAAPVWPRQGQSERALAVGRRALPDWRRRAAATCHDSALSAERASAANSGVRPGRSLLFGSTPRASSACVSVMLPAATACASGGVRRHRRQKSRRRFRHRQGKAFQRFAMRAGSPARHHTSRTRPLPPDLDAPAACHSINAVVVDGRRSAAS